MTREQLTQVEKRVMRTANRPIEREVQKLKSVLEGIGAILKETEKDMKEISSIRLGVQRATRKWKAPMEDHKKEWWVNAIQRYEQE